MATRSSESLAEYLSDKEETPDLRAQREWIASQEGSQEHKIILDLAVLVKEVAGMGEAHRTLCKDLLESILKFAEEEERPGYSDV
jgi:hypothetical protein